MYDMSIPLVDTDTPVEYLFGYSESEYIKVKKKLAFIENKSLVKIQTIQNDMVSAISAIKL